MSNHIHSETTSLGRVTESKNPKRRKIDKLINDRTARRSESDQLIYSSKLLNALRLVHNQTTTSSSPTRNIRNAADRVLAVTAKGRTRWSRAILKNHRRRLHSKILKKVSKKNPNKLDIGAPSSSSSSFGIGGPQSEKFEEVEKRVKVLGRLVPGCSKLRLPSLLDETTDYIAALEMQVRTMAVLAQLLSSTSGAPAN